MSATYARDPGTGVVHVQSPVAGGDFTFCHLPMDGDPETGGFFPDPHPGPSDCAECREAVEEYREAMGGVRWTGEARRKGG